MTNEEAIEILRKIPVGILDLSNEDKWDLTEAIEIAIVALQPSGEPLTLEKLREKWEPCELCESCTNCWFCMNSKTEKPCVDCDEYSKFSPVSYCRYCGRPLTQEACEILEKRIRG